VKATAAKVGDLAEDLDTTITTCFFFFFFCASGLKLTDASVAMIENEIRVKYAYKMGALSGQRDSLISQLNCALQEK